MISIAEMNGLSARDFVARFGAIYEHSSWVAERAHQARPFVSITALAAAMASVVAAARDDEKLALLRAHPDLAGKLVLAGKLTQESTSEQASAGLDRLTEDEMQRFQAANKTYQDRFGFPFIIAVKYWGKTHVLAAFSHRLTRSKEEEMRAALAEVDKIAFLRLLSLVVPAPGGSLTTHVLDTASGRPAEGLRIELYRLDGIRTRVMQATTNEDGRLNAPALANDEMKVGRYELSFATGEYFLAQGLATSVPAFLDRVPIEFAIANPELHYHVPLLLSPWSYSTYRGS